jgi:hypothetical protein
VLTVLGDMGMTKENEAVRRGCEFMLEHQCEDGAFRRKRKKSGHGWVLEGSSEICTHARIVRFLIQFGYGESEVVRRGITWMLAEQREDGMWFCRQEGKRGCLRATIDVLRAAALDAEAANQSGIKKGARAVVELLMLPRMSRFHIGERWGMWEELKYPYFGFSLISALNVLAKLGWTMEEPKIDAAVGYLLDRQLGDGGWPMDACWPDAPIDFGQPGEPNKWLTLDVMRVLKKLMG